MCLKTRQKHGHAEIELQVHIFYFEKMKLRLRYPYKKHENSEIKDTNKIITAANSMRGKPYEKTSFYQ